MESTNQKIFPKRKNNILQIFIDSSAFKAVFDFSDEFHNEAAVFWNESAKKQRKFLTTNFILDETLTLIRSHMGKEASLQLLNDIVVSTQQIQIIRITVAYEKDALDLFKKLPGRGISFTDCESFAVMRQLKISNAFTFDRDFSSAGFKTFPK